MILKIHIDKRTGVVEDVYNELFDLTGVVASTRHQRAGHVEPVHGGWQVRFPDGETLPRVYAKRTAALRAEFVRAQEKRAERRGTVK